MRLTRPKCRCQVSKYMF